MTGRRPKPTHLKLLAGTTRRDRLNLNEPIAAGRPECPDWLDPVSREEWQRVAPLLAEMGVIGAVDRAALAAYCSTYSAWVQARQELTAAGTLTVTNSLGREVPHPLLAISHRAMEQMRRFAIELGLTPSSRRRLTGSNNAPGGDNPFAELAGAGS